MGTPATPAANPTIDRRHNPDPSLHMDLYRALAMIIHRESGGYFDYEDVLSELYFIAVADRGLYRPDGATYSTWFRARGFFLARDRLRLQRGKRRLKVNGKREWVDAQCDGQPRQTLTRPGDGPYPLTFAELREILNRPEFQANERTALSLRAQGMTLKETGLAIGLSHQGVFNTLARVREKVMQAAGLVAA